MITRRTGCRDKFKRDDESPLISSQTFLSFPAFANAFLIQRLFFCFTCASLSELLLLWLMDVTFFFLCEARGVMRLQSNFVIEEKGELLLPLLVVTSGGFALVSPFSCTHLF